MDRSLVRPLLGATSAHQMWSNLQLDYDKRAISYVHNLQKRFFDLKPIAAKGIRTFLSELNDINSQLRNLDAQKVFDDDAVISKVISTLLLDFNAFTTAWELTSPVDKTLANLSVGLVKEEVKLKTAATASIDISKAFYSSSKHNTMQRAGSSGSNTTSGAHHCSGSSCTHPMHKNQPSSTGLINRSSSTVPTTPLTQKQQQSRQKYFDDLKKTTTCHNYGKPGHWQGECPDLTEEGRQELRRQRRPKSQLAAPLSRSFPAVETPPDLPDREVTYTGFMAFEDFQSLGLTEDNSLESYSRHYIWYADSAASSHMTSHRTWFASYSSFPERYWSIQGITPQPLYAAGIGTIAIERLINGQWQSGHIENVLHVPEIGSNLFSITKAAKKDILTTFSSHGCTMTSGGKIVLQGTLQNNLYELQLRVVTPPTDNALVAASFRPAIATESRQSIKVWHARLYHLNVASIKLLVCRELAKGIELLHDDSADTFCEGCCYGKQHRTSFPVNAVHVFAN